MGDTSQSTCHRSWKSVELDFHVTWINGTPTVTFKKEKKKRKTYLDVSVYWQKKRLMLNTCVLLTLLTLSSPSRGLRCNKRGPEELHASREEWIVRIKTHSLMLHCSEKRLCASVVVIFRPGACTLLYFRLELLEVGMFHPFSGGRILLETSGEHRVT